MHRRALAGLISLLVALASVLLVPAAWAGQQATAAAHVTESPARQPAGPVALAHTGLDIAIPTTIGLAVLLIGTALVAWAVLRGSRSRKSRP